MRDFAKDLRPQDSIPFLRRVSADLQKNGAARHLIANLELDSPIPVYAGHQFDGDMAMLSSSPGHPSFTGSASPVLPEVPQSEADLFEIREHTFVKTTFGKRASFAISGRELDLRADRLLSICSRQLSSMHGTSQKGCGAVFALQPHRTLQVRRPRSANLRPSLEIAHACAFRGARQQPLRVLHTLAEPPSCERELVSRQPRP